VTGWIDGILLLILVEAAALLLWRRRTGHGPAARAVLPNLLAGAMLLLAMRLALSDAAPAWVAVCLLGGLVAHLADLRARWS